MKVLKKKWGCLAVPLLLALLMYGCTSRVVDMLNDPDYYIRGRDTTHCWDNGMFTVDWSRRLLYDPETFEEDFKAGRFTYMTVYSLYAKDQSPVILERVESYTEKDGAVYIYSSRGYAILNRDDGTFKVVERTDELTEEEKEIFSNKDAFKTFGYREMTTYGRIMGTISLINLLIAAAKLLKK